MTTRPTQHPASTSDARKRAAENLAAPKWSDLFGIDPDYTGDLSVDEFIARNRAENPAMPDWGSDLREPLDLDAIRAEVEGHAHARARAALLGEVERLRGEVIREVTGKQEVMRQFRELQSESRILPCDAACTDAPEEDCSRHGREPADLWRIIAEVQAARDEALAERDAAREVAQALASTLTYAQNAMIDAAGGRKACSDGPEIDWDVVYARLADLAAAREALARVEVLADEWHALPTWRLRAALAQPATDEGAGA